MLLDESIFPMPDLVKKHKTLVKQFSGSAVKVQHLSLVLPHRPIHFHLEKMIIVPRPKWPIMIFTLLIFILIPPRTGEHLEEAR